MNKHIGIAAVALTLGTIGVPDVPAQESVKRFPLILGADTMTACGYRILRRTPDGDKPVARFTYPTLSILLQYRPQTRDNYIFDTTRYALSDNVEDISSEVTCACVSNDGEIWVGFGFYEGEGFDGVGGIGFYDPRTGASGVLRHPALIDYSVSAMKVTKDTIYAVTQGHYEGSKDVGNGLVAISRRTLGAVARVPPGTNVLWDKDGGESVASLYDRPIEKLIIDHRFVPKKLPDWARSTLEKIKSVGPIRYMTKSLAQERALRREAISRATVIFDEVMRASGPEHIVGNLVSKSGIKLDTPGDTDLKQNCGVDGFACLAINLPGNMWFPEWYAVLLKPSRLLPSVWENSQDWITPKAGDSWTFERYNETFIITVDTLLTKEAKCQYSTSTIGVDYYESAAIHFKFLKLKN